MLDHRLVEIENLLLVLQVKVEGAQFMYNFTDDLSHAGHYLVMIVLNLQRS